MQKTNSGILFGWNHGDKGWGDAMNENLFRLGTFCNMSVKSFTAGTPVTANEGDAFIVPKDATQAWLGHDFEIAIYQNSNWTFYAPFDGLCVYSKANSRLVVYSSGEWLKGQAFVPLAQEEP